MTPNQSGVMYPQFTAMATASAYIINIPEQRRKVILDRVDDFPNATAAEPVPLFSHGKNAALVVFASFKDDKLTHVANGRKGSSAGTGLVRLNMEDLQRLESPIGFDELVRLVPKKFRAPLRRVLESDGLLPPKTLAAVVDVMTKRNPGIAPRLARFSERRAAALRDLRPAEAQNLAAQKESLGLALDIAGLSKAELLAWSPPDGKPATFLEGLPGARVREDVMLIKDFTTVPGFQCNWRRLQRCCDDVREPAKSRPATYCVRGQPPAARRTDWRRPHLLQRALSRLRTGSIQGHGERQRRARVSLAGGRPVHGRDRAHGHDTRRTREVLGRHRAGWLSDVQQSLLPEVLLAHGIQSRRQRLVQRNLFAARSMEKAERQWQTEGPEGRQCFIVQQCWQATDKLRIHHASRKLMGWHHGSAIGRA